MEILTSTLQRRGRGRATDYARRKVGVLKVRLFALLRQTFVQALPETVRALSPCWIAQRALARRPGKTLSLDVMTALAEAFNIGERETLPRTIGGRYGLSSKEFGPACVLAVFTVMNFQPREKPKPQFYGGHL